MTESRGPYDQGQPVLSTVQVVDDTGALGDPSQVYFVAEGEDGTFIRDDFGTNPSHFGHPSTGVFSYEWLPTCGGLWIRRFYNPSGTLRFSEQVEIQVTPDTLT